MASAFLIESNSHRSDSGSSNDALQPSGAAAPAVAQLMSSSSAKSPRLFSASGLLCGALFVAGTCGYRFFERWDWLDCAYATIGVLTTVGMVLPPRTPSSRLLTSVLNVASLGVVSVWLGEISGARYNFTRRALGFGKAARSPSVDLIVFATAALVPLAVATVAFSVTEGWSIGESAFVALAGATGLGLADNAPVTKAGKVAFAVYLLVNMGVTLNACSSLGHLVRISFCAAGLRLPLTVFHATLPALPYTQMISVLNNSGAARAVHDDSKN